MRIDTVYVITDGRQCIVFTERAQGERFSELSATPMMECELLDEDQGDSAVRDYSDDGKG